MKHLKYFISSIIVVFFTINNTHAQLPTIDSVYYDRTSGTINALISGVENKVYNFEAEFRTPDATYKPMKENVTMHLGHTSNQSILTWDFRKEVSNDINNRFRTTLKTYPFVRHTPFGNVVSSLMLPGSGGGKKVRGSGGAWLKGILGWGLVLTGTTFMLLASSQYDTYSQSHSQSEMASNLSDYNLYTTLSMVSYGAAGAIWTIDLATILAKNGRAGRNATKVNGKKYIPKLSDPINITNDKEKLDTRSPYDITMESAKSYFDLNLMERAKELYEKALTYKPKDELATSQINKINDKLYRGKRGLPPNLYAELAYEDANGNGILEAGETSKLKVTLRNEGNGYANDLKIKITDSIADNSIEYTPVNIDVLRNGETKEIEIPIKANINVKTNQHRLEINVLEKYGYDMDPAYLVLNTFAYNPPKIVVSGIDIYDEGEGTSAIKADGSIQPGEQVKVKVVLQNVGQNPAIDTKYNIVTPNENIYLDNVSGSLGKIAVGEVKEINFILSPNKRTQGLDTLPIYLSIKEFVGLGSFANQKLPIIMDRKPTKPQIVNVEANVSELQKSVAKFEFKSQKFTVNIGKITDIRKIDNSKSSRKNAIAVVLGIEKYQNIAPAPYAANDASLMEEYFKKRLGIENVILLRNEEVTSTRLRKIFNPSYGDLQRSIVKGETDVFVYYSGHGVPNKEGDKVFLFPNDGIKEGIEDFGYEMNKLYADLNALEAHNVTVILDACFSGSSRASEKLIASNVSGAKGVKLKAKYDFTKYPNFTVINSSSGEETSLGLDASESGLFTYYFCKGLQGEADVDNNHKITVGEMKNYVTSNVKEASKKIAGLQSPQFWGNENAVLVEY